MDFEGIFDFIFLNCNYFKLQFKCFHDSFTWSSDIRGLELSLCEAWNPISFAPCGNAIHLGARLAAGVNRNNLAQVKNMHLTYKRSSSIIHNVNTT